MLIAPGPGEIEITSDAMKKVSHSSRVIACSKSETVSGRIPFITAYFILVVEVRTYRIIPTIAAAEDYEIVSVRKRRTLAWHKDVPTFSVTISH